MNENDQHNVEHTQADSGRWNSGGWLCATTDVLVFPFRIRAEAKATFNSLDTQTASKRRAHAIGYTAKNKIAYIFLLKVNHSNQLNAYV